MSTNSDAYRRATQLQREVRKDFRRRDEISGRVFLAILGLMTSPKVVEGKYKASNLTGWNLEVARRRSSLREKLIEGGTKPAQRGFSLHRRGGSRWDCTE